MQALLLEHEREMHAIHVEAEQRRHEILLRAKKQKQALLKEKLAYQALDNWRAEQATGFLNTGPHANEKYRHVFATERPVTNT